MGVDRLAVLLHVVGDPRPAPGDLEVAPVRRRAPAAVAASAGCQRHRPLMQIRSRVGVVSVCLGQVPDRPHTGRQHRGVWSPARGPAWRARQAHAVASTVTIAIARFFIRRQDIAPCTSRQARGRSPQTGCSSGSRTVCLAHGPAIQQIAVGHRLPGPVRVPIGLSPHDIQDRSQPAKSIRRGIGHHQPVHAVDVLGRGPSVFECDQAPEDGGFAMVE